MGGFPDQQPVPEGGQELRADDASIRSPDFSVVDDMIGTTFWEHLGMLQRPSYRRKWEEKLAWYRANGIVSRAEGGGTKGTLITTEDGDDGSISSADMQALIDEILGCPGSLDERSNDMQYWIYKNNREGGPSGYWGDWAAHVFDSTKAVEWGGSYSTTSPEVLRTLDERVAVGDVIMAYQTDDKQIVGFCTITAIKGRTGDRKLHLKPIYRLKTPLKIHEAKRGTILASSSAVNGRVMLRELSKAEMTELLRVAGAPSTLLKGTTKTPYKP